MKSERARMVLLLAVAVLVYANSLLNGFTMDDRLYIFINPAVTNPSVGKLFAPNEATALFRPVTIASFALNYAAGGERALSYHLANLLLQAAVTLLLYLVLRKILECYSQGSTVAWVAALLFAVHPIHVEAVASIVGRAELFAAGFVLASWLCHLYDRPVLSFMCFALALLSKESAIALAPLILVGDYVRGQFKPLARYLGVAGVALAYLPVLWVAHGGGFGPKVIDFVNNPLVALPAHLRILNALRMAWKYIFLQLYPATLSCDYSYNSIPLYATWGHLSAAALASLVVLAAWAWAFFKNKKEWFLAGAIYFAGFAVTGNILMTAGPPVGERLAYLPSAGFCLLVALIWAVVAKRWSKPAWVALLLVVAALGVRTWVRNRDWKDNPTLYFADIQAVPGSVKLHDFIVAQYLARNDWNAASAVARETLQLYPAFPPELKAMGTGEYDFRLLKLAELYANGGDMEEALAFSNLVIGRTPGLSLAWSERAAVRYQQGKRAQALADVQNALRLNPANRQALSLLKLLVPVSTAP